MTLDKAIEVYEFWANAHERDAEYHRPLGYSHETIANVAEMQAREERQIAEWLKELKAYRETYPYGVDRFNGADTPQTDAEITEFAKEIVHKMIDNSVIAEDAYPDLRQRMHEAVGETNEDERRLDNLKTLIDVTNWCLDGLQFAMASGYGRAEYSMAEISYTAQCALDEYGRWISDVLEEQIAEQTEPQICDTCRYYNSNIPCGSTPSACKEADKFAEEFVDGLKKLKPKVEPQTDEFKNFDREDLILLIECQKERIGELLADKDTPQTEEEILREQCRAFIDIVKQTDCPWK